MKAYLYALIAGEDNPLIATHLVREYLQARILQSLQRAGAMQSLAFHGGTALRFLYEIPRYSEDLDFALEYAPERYDFRGYLRQIEKDLSAEAYALDFKVNDKRVVHKAFIRFRGLLYELGLSGHQSEVLAVKLEVDTRPPTGARLTTTSLKRHVVALNLQHHDPTSLFAGKLHAVLQRPYPKGRDIFDLWWYLNQPDWDEPNLILLNEALSHSGWQAGVLTPENWATFVERRIKELDWQTEVVRDVSPFIMRPDTLHSFNQASLLALLQQKSGW